MCSAHFWKLSSNIHDISIRSIIYFRSIGYYSHTTSILSAYIIFLCRLYKFIDPENAESNSYNIHVFNYFNNSTSFSPESNTSVNLMPQFGEDGQNMGNLTQNKFCGRILTNVRILCLSHCPYLLLLQNSTSEFSRVNKAMSESPGMAKCLSSQSPGLPILPTLGYHIYWCINVTLFTMFISHINC